MNKNNHKQCDQNKINSAVQLLKKQLNRESLCYQHQLIIHMNIKLQIKWSIIIKHPLFIEYTQEQCITIMKKIDFIKLIPQRKIPQKIRLSYKNNEKIVFISGLNQNIILQYIEIFHKIHNNKFNSKNLCWISSKNQFWIVIQSIDKQISQNFRKFARKRKKQCEVDQRYRINMKKVRIILENQDFRSLLVNAMSQIKKKNFFQHIYKMTNDYPHHYSLFNNQFTNMAQLKQQQSECDGYSEDKSRSSEVLDQNNKLQQIIQTTEQGTQAGCMASQNNTIIETNYLQKTSSNCNKIQQVTLKSNHQNFRSKQKQNPKQEQQNQQNSSKLNQKLQRENQSSKLVSNFMKQPIIMKQYKHTNIQTDTEQSQFIQIPYNRIKNIMIQSQIQDNPDINKLPKYILCQSIEEQNRHLFFKSIQQRSKQNNYNRNQQI